MSLELAKKGLTLVDSPVTWKRKIHESQPLGDVIKQYMKDTASLVVWQRQQISWGRWDGSTLVFANKETLDENQVIEIRVFNDNEELHLYRAVMVLMKAATSATVPARYKATSTP